MSTTYFSNDFFQFLVDLGQNNNKPWFDANKKRYEQSVRDPLLRFVADFDAPLRQLAPGWRADARPVGGSVMRIYRDIRFSKDKTPYKTHMAAHFGHENPVEGATPGFYLHLAPDHCGFGAGLWQPQPEPLLRVRQAIAGDAAGWQASVRGAEHKSACGFIGEQLKKPPAGFDPSHPCIDDIRRKDFAINFPLADADVLAADFLQRVVERARSAVPFVRFLGRATGVAGLS